jgi:hypothetical protein
MERAVVVQGGERIIEETMTPATGRICLAVGYSDLPDAVEQRLGSDLGEPHLSGGNT